MGYTPGSRATWSSRSTVVNCCRKSTSCCVDRDAGTSDNLLSADAAMALLSDIEQRSHEAAAHLPESSAVRDVWDGLVFSVAGVRIVAAMDEVSEMLPFQERITRVPGAKPWMLGLANVRGSLLPSSTCSCISVARRWCRPRLRASWCCVCVGWWRGLLVPRYRGMRISVFHDRLSDARMKGALRGLYVRGVRHAWRGLACVQHDSAGSRPEFRTASAYGQRHGGQV